MRHRLCGPSTYGLNGLDREMSTPPTLRRGTPALPFFTTGRPVSQDFGLEFVVSLLLLIFINLLLICLIFFDLYRKPSQSCRASPAAWADSLWLYYNGSCAVLLKLTLQLMDWFSHEMLMSTTMWFLCSPFLTTLSSSSLKFPQFSPLISWVPNAFMICSSRMSLLSLTCHNLTSFIG